MHGKRKCQERKDRDSLARRAFAPFATSGCVYIPATYTLLSYVLPRSKVLVAVMHGTSTVLRVWVCCR